MDPDILEMETPVKVDQVINLFQLEPNNPVETKIKLKKRKKTVAAVYLSLLVIESRKSFMRLNHQK